MNNTRKNDYHEGGYNKDIKNNNNGYEKEGRLD